MDIYNGLITDRL